MTCPSKPTNFAPGWMPCGSVSPRACVCVPGHDAAAVQPVQPRPMGVGRRKLLISLMKVPIRPAVQPKTAFHLMCAHTRRQAGACLRALARTNHPHTFGGLDGWTDQALARVPAVQPLVQPSSNPTTLPIKTMTQPAAQTSTAVNMRDHMPLVADFIDRKRVEWGKTYVNDCLRKALAGEAGWFYAIEAGHTVGTPFPVGHPIDAEQRMAVLVQAKFAAFMRWPDVQASASAVVQGVPHGAA